MILYYRCFTDLPHFYSRHLSSTAAAAAAAAAAGTVNNILQDNVHIGVLTVKESLAFAAELRLVETHTYAHTRIHSRTHLRAHMHSHTHTRVHL